MKKRPTKNYIIISIIYLAVFVFLFYFVKWYDTLDDYRRQIPVLRDVLQEVDTLEVDHYLQEVPNAVLYLCTASEDKCRSFESDFRYLIKKKELDSIITYVNLSLEQNPGAYLASFGNKYGATLKEDSYPILIQFEEGEIREYQPNLTIALAEAFLEGHNE